MSLRRFFKMEDMLEFSAQIFFRAREEGFHRLYAEMEGSGDLRLFHLPVIEENDGFALSFWEFLQGFSDGFFALADFHLGEDVFAGIGDSEERVRVFISALSGSVRVSAKIDGDGGDPYFGRSGFWGEAAGALPDSEETFLRDIFGEDGVACHSAGEGVDRGEISIHQRGIGVLVAMGDGDHKIFVLAIFRFFCGGRHSWFLFCPITLYYAGGLRIRLLFIFRRLGFFADDFGEELMDVFLSLGEGFMEGLEVFHACGACEEGEERFGRGVGGEDSVQAET